MNRLTSAEKVKLIQETAKKLDIKPYEFGNNTQISTFAARSLLNGNTEKPSIRTINAMYNYITEKDHGENFKAQESTTTYGKSVEDLIALKVIEAITPMLQQLDRNIKELINRDGNRKLDILELKEMIEDINHILMPSKKRN